MNERDGVVFRVFGPFLPIVVAGLVVFRDRGAMLGGRDAVVDVIPGDRRSGGPA